MTNDLARILLAIVSLLTVFRSTYTIDCEQRAEAGCRLRRARLL